MRKAWSSSTASSQSTSRFAQTSLSLRERRTSSSSWTRLWKERERERERESLAKRGGVLARWPPLPGCERVGASLCGRVGVFDPGLRRGKVRVQLEPPLRREVRAQLACAVEESLSSWLCVVSTGFPQQGDPTGERERERESLWFQVNILLGSDTIRSNASSSPED